MYNFVDKKFKQFYADLSKDVEKAKTFYDDNLSDYYKWKCAKHAYLSEEFIRGCLQSPLDLAKGFSLILKNNESKDYDIRDVYILLDILHNCKQFYNTIKPHLIHSARNCRNYWYAHLKKSEISDSDFTPYAVDLKALIFVLRNAK